MRLAHVIGAVSAATLIITADRNQGARSYPYSDASIAPNDSGEVIDSTKETKRAKRRRLAQSRRQMK